MTFDEFIDTYDKPGSIILLLGKRKVPENERRLLTELGRKLAGASEHILFRGGNAEGADQLFASAVSLVNSDRMEVVTPYTGHRQEHSQQFRTVSLDQVDLASEPDITYHSKLDKKSRNLITDYEKGHKSKYANYGAYLLRNTLMVVGAKGLNVPKASFAIFYDDLKKPGDGGTGFTMKVCTSAGVPFIDQRMWLDWLK
jgi:hypothetical protein